MSVQAQWNLDYTVGTALNVGLGILRAASRDNVQPLAILACEKFGNTIAMCQETCRKVENAMMTPAPIPVAFLRATVGFFDDDCGTQLSKSLAGVQFLGLASALVTSMGPFEAGNALELLLKNSTPDRTLLPTARQLKDLLAAIEPRCYTCGFTDSVVGWRLFLSQNLLLKNVEESLRSSWALESYRPSDEGIESLVSGLRHIARIGEGQNPRSPVFVLLNPKFPKSKEFRLAVSSSLANITDIVTHSEKPSFWDPLVTIETYGNLRLQQTGFDTGAAHRAFCHALPYCITGIMSRPELYLSPSDTGGDDARESEDERDNILRLGSSLNAFPGNRAIFALARRMFGARVIEESKSLEIGKTIADLPEIELHLNHLAKHCGCPVCTSDFKIKQRYQKCLKTGIFQRLGLIVSDVMALSLFLHSETLLVRSSSFTDETLHPPFVNAIIHWVQSLGRSPFSWSVGDLISLALSLVGHLHPYDNTLKRSQWIMSSKHGQVVYPLIFNTYEITEAGFPLLVWHPGLIHYEGDVYESALAQHPGNCVQSPMSESLKGVPVLGPIDHSPLQYEMVG